MTWILFINAAQLCLVSENEWNPIEWDRAAEELTWERVKYFFLYLTHAPSAVMKSFRNMQLAQSTNIFPVTFNSSILNCMQHKFSASGYK